MTEERKRILEMLSEGKITSEEAEKLLAALSKGEEVVSGNGSSTPRYLRVMVEPGPDSKNSDRVNIRVPQPVILMCIRSSRVRHTLSTMKGMQNWNILLTALF